MDRFVLSSLAHNDGADAGASSIVRSPQPVVCGLRLLTSQICCRSATRELQTQSPFFIGTQEICAPKLASANAHGPFVAGKYLFVQRQTRCAAKLSERCTASPRLAAEALVFEVGAICRVGCADPIPHF